MFSFKVSNFILHSGEFQVSRRLNLVYGGGSVGLMGLVSQEVYRGGGQVIGYNISYYYLHSYIFGLSCLLYFAKNLDLFNAFNLQNHSQNSHAKRGRSIIIHY